MRFTWWSADGFLQPSIVMTESSTMTGLTRIVTHAYNFTVVCFSSYERRSAPARVPMMLCNASYYGTLAVVRSLGRAGVPVVTADSAILAAGRYSRYSSLHLSCPPSEMTDRWTEWLLNLGRSGPKRAIYATSDAVSFALSHYRDELRSFFYLYQPDRDAMMCILDKGLPLEHARAVGIDTPDTWLPESAEEAARMACEAGGTLVVKPRSRLLDAVTPRAP